MYILEEHHRYVRQIFQLYFGWFTFFVTVNFAAMGWVATSSKPHKLVQVSFVFLLQIILGIIASIFVARYLRAAKDKEMVLAKNTNHAVISVIPSNMYGQVIRLIYAALFLVTVGWLLVIDNFAPWQCWLQFD